MGRESIKVREEKGAIAWEVRQEPEKQGREPPRAWGWRCFHLAHPPPSPPLSHDGRWSASRALDKAERKLRIRTTSATHRPESTALAPPRARWAVGSASTLGKAGVDQILARQDTLMARATSSLPNQLGAWLQPLPSGKSPWVLRMHRLPLSRRRDPRLTDEICIMMICIWGLRACEHIWDRAAAEIPTNVAHAYSVAVPTTFCSH